MLSTFLPFGLSRDDGRLAPERGECDFFGVPKGVGLRALECVFRLLLDLPEDSCDLPLFLSPRWLSPLRDGLELLEPFELLELREPFDLSRFLSLSFFSFSFLSLLPFGVRGRREGLESERAGVAGSDGAGATDKTFR